MGAFENVVGMMAQMDVFRLFFPWLLILAIVYGVLEKYQMFSEDEQVNGVIALAFSFVTVGGTYLFIPAGTLTSLAAGLTFSVFAILGLMILLAVSGYDLSEGFEEDSLPVGMAILFAILTILGAFFFNVDVLGLLGGNQSLPTTEVFNEIVMPILMLIFIIIIVALTMGGGSDDG